MGKALGGPFFLFVFCITFKKWATNFFLLPNIMLPYPQYKYIKGTQNTENAWIINATYAGQREGSFGEQAKKICLAVCLTQYFWCIDEQRVATVRSPPFAHAPTSTRRRLAVTVLHTRGTPTHFGGDHVSSSRRGCLSQLLLTMQHNIHEMQW